MSREVLKKKIRDMKKQRRGGGGGGGLPTPPMSEINEMIGTIAKNPEMMNQFSKLLDPRCKDFASSIDSLSTALSNNAQSKTSNDDRRSVSVGTETSQTERTTTPELTLVECSAVAVQPSGSGMSCYATKDMMEDDVIEYGFGTRDSESSSDSFLHYSGCGDFYRKILDGNAWIEEDFVTGVFQIKAKRTIEKDDEITLDEIATKSSHDA